MRPTLIALIVCMQFTTIAWSSQAQDPLDVWREFVAVHRADKITSEMICPYYQSFSDPLLGFLADMRANANWAEWEQPLEVHRVDDQIHFLIELTLDGQKNTYTFSFLLKSSHWCFQHLEAIHIRLDKVGLLPTSNFPDVSEEWKAWIREEIRISKLVRLFNFIAEQDSRDAALNFFRDGTGYVLGARTWVPFVPVKRAFVLYLCWEQANLRGNEVILEVLEEEYARVRIQPQFFLLYERAGHLKQQIPFVDYRAIFETIWQDRANAAGWELKIEYEQEACILNFSTPTTAP